ncbi:MAG: DUF3862 domain-containing protein [Pseudomonadota bacterium]
MRHKIIKKTLLCILAISFLFAIGCSKLTSENYGRLELGMDYNKVIEILGEADRCSGAMGAKTCKWGNNEKYINVKLLGDKVVLFSMKGL